MKSTESNVGENFIRNSVNMYANHPLQNMNKKKGENVIWEHIFFQISYTTNLKIENQKFCCDREFHSLVVTFGEKI